MKIKCMMVFLILSVASPFIAIAHGAETKGKAHKSHKADKTPVTYIDASAPSAPESALPEIVSKGKL
jgi:hypothetical protein